MIMTTDGYKLPLQVKTQMDNINVCRKQSGLNAAKHKRKLQYNFIANLCNTLAENIMYSKISFMCVINQTKVILFKFYFI